MSDLRYEFLTYEQFPNDAYVKEVVTVLINDAIILPYQHVTMKDGGSFWSFPGVSPLKADGTKKRINGEFDSKKAKLNFENDLDGFVRSRNGQAIPSHQPQPSTQSMTTQGPNFGTSEQGVGVVDQNLPF